MLLYVEIRPAVTPDLCSSVFSATTSLEVIRICQIPHAYLTCNMARNSTFKLPTRAWPRLCGYRLFLTFLLFNGQPVSFFCIFPFFWSFKASLFQLKVVIEGILQDRDGEMPARELMIAGRGCWWGSMFSCSRQLLSRGFPLPGCHTGKAASAQIAQG